MPSIYDIYEFHLEPKDLKDKAHLVKVESAKKDSIFVPRVNKREEKVVLRFVNRRKNMLLNKTQAGAMNDIAGTDDYTKWVGVEVVLVAGRASNGKDTIVITTREESGDFDLMYPPPTEKEKLAINTPLPAGWWSALGTQAVDYATGVWKCGQAEAYARIKREVDGEAVSRHLPEAEFKEWVASCTVG